MTTKKDTETKKVEEKAKAETVAPAREEKKIFSGFFNAYVSTTRKTVEGIIEVDKALFGYAKEAVQGYTKLSKDTMQAKCLNDVIDLHAAHLNNRIEASTANAREIVELSKNKAKEAYAPMKSVIDTYRVQKAS